MDARELYAHIFDNSLAQLVGSDPDSEERLTIASAHANAAIKCLAEAAEPTQYVNPWTGDRIFNTGNGHASKVRDVPIGDREQNAEGDL